MELQLGLREEEPELEGSCGRAAEEDDRQRDGQQAGASDAQADEPVEPGESCSSPVLVAGSLGRISVA
jgi:hypothetical protein